jgi:hypothetical protein
VQDIWPIAFMANDYDNPYAPPTEVSTFVEPDIASSIYRDGNKLVMHKRAVLPDICVKTNVPTSRRLRRKMFWHHPLYYIIAPIALLLYVIVALIVRQTAKISVPISDDVYRRRWKWIGIGWLGSLGSLAACVATVIEMERGNYMAILFVISLIAVFVFAVLGAMFSAIVLPAKITRNYVWMTGASSEYLNRWPQAPVGLR